MGINGVAAGMKADGFAAGSGIIGTATCTTDWPAVAVTLLIKYLDCLSISVSSTPFQFATAGPASAAGGFAGGLAVPGCRPFASLALLLGGVVLACLAGGDDFEEADDLDEADDFDDVGGLDEADGLDEAGGLDFVWVTVWPPDAGFVGLGPGLVNDTEVTTLPVVVSPVVHRRMSCWATLQGSPWTVKETKRCCGGSFSLAE